MADIDNGASPLDADIEKGNVVDDVPKGQRTADDVPKPQSRRGSDIAPVHTKKIEKSKAMKMILSSQLDKSKIEKALEIHPVEVVSQLS